MSKSIKLAITMGDPGGIGPEVALKAVYRSKWPDSIRFVLIGNKDVWLQYARQCRLPQPYECKNIEEADNNRISIWEALPRTTNKKSYSIVRWQAGKTGKAEGRASLLWVRAAAEGCQEGKFDGMVTGPICKHSIQAAGYKFPGHTEYLAHLTGCGKVAMMLIGGPLHVVLATRHLPLTRVASALTRSEIIEAVEMANGAVKWLNLHPRNIGVCALNPHAGEDGLLGNEELKIIAPALRYLRRRGMAVAGPIPADVIFYQAMQNKFGAIVAMYHDQGLAPLKMIAFEKGVNLTLGLPFVRTSPDHGTAFDIAGTGLASGSSMVEAISLAIKLAKRPNPWKR